MQVLRLGVIFGLMPDVFTLFEAPKHPHTVRLISLSARGGA